MATNSIYHFTFTYGAAGGGDKGGGGDYYNGWTADAPGLYQQGQKFATKDGVYEIKHVDTYNVDLEQTYGKNFEAKSVYVTNYHDGATNADYKPYYYSNLERGAPDGKSGHGGLGSEQDYVKAPNTEHYHNFGAGGEYSYGGAKPDSKYTFTYRDGDSGSWYKGWVVDDADRYAQGQRVDTAKGWYTIDKEEAVPYSTGWHPEPKDHKHDNGHVHITEYHKADTGRTYKEADFYSYNKGDGYASGYHGFGSEVEYVNNGGTWQNYVANGDIVW